MTMVTLVRPPRPPFHRPTLVAGVPQPRRHRRCRHLVKKGGAK